MNSLNRYNISRERERVKVFCTQRKKLRVPEQSLSHRRPISLIPFASSASREIGWCISIQFAARVLACVSASFLSSLSLSLSVYIFMCACKCTECVCGGVPLCACLYHINTLIVRASWTIGIHIYVCMAWCCLSYQSNAPGLYLNSLCTLFFLSFFHYLSILFPVVRSSIHQRVATGSTSFGAQSDQREERPRSHCGNENLPPARSASCTLRLYILYILFALWSLRIYIYIYRETLLPAPSARYIFATIHRSRRATGTRWLRPGAAMADTDTRTDSSLAY